VETPAPVVSDPGPGWRIPLPVWATALLLALLACWPYWAANRATPDGWRFTGVVHPSPDFVQYRVWMRQSQAEGPVVTDRFTTEANRAHLPVVFYYFLGQVARATGSRPETVMAFAAAPLTFLLVLLLYDLCRRFLPPGRARGWALFAMLLGGGLGAYLKELRDLGYRLGIALVGRLVVTPMQEATVFEDLRGTYIVTSIFDTHFLLIWLLTTAAILALYLAITRPAAWRVLLAAVLCAAITVVHVYEGVLLLLILAAVVSLLWWRGLAVRPALITCGVAGGATLATLATLALLQRHSGLPLPDWRGNPVLPAMFVLGYPLQLLVILPGLRRYWADATLPQLFLLAWAGGCAVLTFAGPFYPWPARGLMTLQIPLALIAAAIYFRERGRMPARHAVVALLLLGLTPLQVVRNLGNRLEFRSTVPYMWLSPGQQQILEALAATANATDVLAADPNDVVWLAPEFPGRHYAGHFFLAVDFARKREELAHLTEASQGERERFLRDHGITLLYVDPDGHPESYSGLPGLTALVQNKAGTLFRFLPEPGRVP